MNTKPVMRDRDADIMRILCAYFVVLIHVSAAQPFSLYSVVFNSLARFSVPVFVMISGRYMLSAKPAPRALAAKCLRLFAVMLVWSLVYYLYGIQTGDILRAGPKPLFIFLLTEPVHFWYIYAAIGLYILTPCLYVFCKNASQKDLLYALVLTFVLGSLVTVMDATSHFSLLKAVVGKMKLNWTTGFVFCYLLGHYLSRYGFPRKLRPALYVLGIIGVAATAAGTMALSGGGRDANYLLFSFFAPNVLVTAAAFYVLLGHLAPGTGAAGERIRGAVGALASGTLGIYLIHVLILSVVLRLLPAAGGLFLPLQALVVFLVSAVCVWVLRKIPLFKKLV